MEPNTDKDKVHSDAKIDPAPEDSHASISRKVADSVPRTRAILFQDVIQVLALYTVSLLIGRHFLAPFFLVIFLGLVAEMRLWNMKQDFEKAITSIRLDYGTTIEKSNATMKDLFEGNQAMKYVAQNSLDTVYELQKASYKSREANREKDILVFRKQSNEMRLGYFQVYFSLCEGIIGLIEQIIQKVKSTSAQPKVKGTKRNNNHRNDGYNNNLTSPLERVAAELKQIQSTTKEQIAVAEKIDAILERDGLLPKEVDRLLREAEGDLQHPQDALPLQLPPGSRTPNTELLSSPLGENMDGKLEKHYEDLDKWFQSMQDRPIVEDEHR